VIDKVLMQEVAYQLDKVLLAILHRRKKSPCLTFLLWSKLYELKSHKVVVAKIQELDHLHLKTKYFHGYDLKRVCRQHCESINFNWGYSSMSTTEDKKVKNWYNAVRKTHPGMEISTPHDPPTQDIQV